MILLAGTIAFTACDSNREPGKVYMPDMAYSRAVESYSEHDSAFTRDIHAVGGKLIFYNAVPPKGTIKRGELFPDNMPADTTGSYASSASFKNPFDSLSKNQMAEAGRLFNINCAICHGAKGEGNGPIYDKIGGVANLTEASKVALADGTIYHVISYGKGVMGSYASQLSRAQRWMIVKYIRTEIQPKPTASPAAGTAVADTAKKAK